MQLRKVTPTSPFQVLLRPLPFLATLPPSVYFTRGLKTVWIFSHPPKRILSRFYVAFLGFATLFQLPPLPTYSSLIFRTYSILLDPWMIYSTRTARKMRTLSIPLLANGAICLFL